MGWIGEATIGSVCGRKLISWSRCRETNAASGLTPHVAVRVAGWGNIGEFQSSMCLMLTMLSDNGGHDW